MKGKGKGMSGWEVKTNLRAVVERFTPERARKIMEVQDALWARLPASEKFKRNRPISESTVKMIGLQIDAKEWRVTADPIRFAKDGRVLDGQNRLTAIARGTTTVESLVVYGLENDIFPLLDIGGKKRTPSETLITMGYENAKRLAAALRNVYVYKHRPTIGALGGGSFGLDKTGKNRNQQVLILMEMYPGMEQIVATGVSHRTPILPEAVTNACYYLFREKDPILAESFMDDLATGIGLKHGDPIYALRERIIRQRAIRSTTHQWNRGFMMMLVIYAWNAVRKGRTLTKFSSKLDGSLPEVL